jgi:chromate transport protein ChrA
MSLLQFVSTIIHDLLIFIGAMAVLLVVLAIAIARLPPDNPLKRILHALSLRIAAMIGAGAIAIPIEPIPGLDIVYDVAAPLALTYFWVTFFRQAATILKSVKRLPQPPS